MSGRSSQEVCGSCADKYLVLQFHTTIGTIEGGEVKKVRRLWAEQVLLERWKRKLLF